VPTAERFAGCAVYLRVLAVLFVAFTTASWRSAGPGQALAVAGAGLGLLVVAAIWGRKHTARRRQVEAAAAPGEDEQLSCVLVAAAQDAIICMDHEGRVTLWNPAAQAVFGYTTGEAIGKNLHRLLAPGRFHQAHQEAFGKFTTSGTGPAIGRTLELVGVRKSGEEFPIELSLSTIRRQGCWHSVGIVRDITARKKAEQALAISETKFRTLYESTDDAVMLLRGDRFFDCNQSAVRLFGCKDKAEFCTKHPADLSPLTQPCGAGSLALSSGRIETAKAQGWNRFEWVHKRLDNGRTFSAEVLLNVMNLGEQPFIQAVVRDISGRKKGETERAEREALHRSLLENLTSGVVILDAETHRIESVNPAAAAMFGAPEEKIVGRECHHFLCPAELGRCPVTDLGEVIDNSDRTLLRADGRRLPILKSAKRIVIGGREKLLECFVDISDRKRIEEAANELAAKASAASKAKSEFLANMSHEIRTPMNGVIGMTGLLLESGLTEQQRRYAEIVRASGESLLGIIDDILDFSKIEAKKLNLEIREFDLSLLLYELAESMAARAHEKAIELLCEVDPEAPVLLRGDPGRLRQVLTNLVGNAIKFTQSGEVVVRVTAESLASQGLLLRFTVRDTGIGIPPDKIALLFDKFSQVDASTTRKYGGTGLGLAISKQLTEMMGGEIGVDSEPGKGSEFWFTVRLERQPDDTGVESLPPVNLRGVRVLIVDDNASNREALVRRMASWEMRPMGTGNGPGALQTLCRAVEEQDPFRLAVIDMQMPGMDGESVGRTIRADSRLADTRMVMLTPLGAREDAQGIEAVGFAASVAKPIRPQALCSLLSDVMSREPGTLPRSAVQAATGKEPGRFDGGGARILLVEDNLTNQQVALGILSKFGLRTDTALNGAEAIQALGSVTYDLVLMDVLMPVMDGMEATRRIRSGESAASHPRIPIVAMTAQAMGGDRERCLEAGMDDYVSKPVSPRALADVLSRWLPQVEPGPLAEEPSKAGTGAQQVWDEPALLERLMGDRAVAKVVLRGFLDDIPRQIANMRTHLDTGAAPDVQRQAHSIKGAAASVGGNSLCALAFEIEQAGKAGDLSAAAARMNDLESEFDRLREAITAGSEPEPQGRNK
jgi:PAS domain S-box-containing protein